MADNDSKFDFDVAFSFHSLDQPLAIQLNDLLQDQFKTFIWLEQQKVLAGTDGEVMLNSVYGEKARVVVIFYRKEWGETPYTRIEQTAVRNRAYHDGYDFTLFIPTEKPPSTPPWLPVPRLTLALDRFGLAGAAGAIETKVRQLGGLPVVESVADRAARFQRREALDKARQQFRKSDVGVAAAHSSFEATLKSLSEHIEELAHPPTALQFRLSPIPIERNFYLLRAVKGCATIRWTTHYSNDLDGSELEVKFFDGPPKLPGRIPAFREGRNVKSLTFDYELIRDGYHGFVERGGQRREFPSNELASHILTTMMDLADKMRE